MILLLWSLFFVHALAQVPTVPNNQVQALKDFYTTFGGENWYHQDNWKNDASLCSSQGWFGVSCIVDPIDPFTLDIFQLTFNQNNLKGDFSSFQGWGNWTYLTYLYLNDNKLTGSIPEEFYDVSQRLQAIQINGNKIGGPISPKIGRLTMLTQLQANGNSFRGIVPPDLFDLPAMEMLLLGNNQLNGNVVINKAAASNMNYLDLSNNMFQGTIPETIWDYTNLRILLLSGTPGASSGFTGTISEKIAQLKSVQILSLSDNQLTGLIPQGLLALRTLEQLSLFSNRLTGSIPADLSYFPGIKMLSFGNNKLVGDLPSSLWSLTFLELLDLGLNAISGTIPKEISNLQNLQVLNLKGVPYKNRPGKNVLTGSIPKTLWSLPLLKTIFLSFNALEGTLPEDIGNLVNLETLTLDSNFLEYTLPDAIYTFRSLTTLLLSNNEFIGMIKPDIANLTKLTSLDLKNNEFQGFVPEFFNVSHNFTQKNILASNMFTCPLPKNAQRLYGAYCTTASISQINPLWVFNGDQTSVEVAGSNIPKLEPLMECKVEDNNGNFVMIGKVFVYSPNKMKCNFPENKLQGTFKLSLWLQGVLLTQTLYINFYGTPTITSLSQTQEREQGSGSDSITIFGTDFVNTGQTVCVYGDMAPVPATFISSTVLQCGVPPHQPGTLKFSVGNLQDHLSNSISFYYYPWCDGFPVCGGSDKGSCINETGKLPYCDCNNSNFNLNLSCADCLPLHYGPECEPCRECNSGTCNEGYSGSGTCTCSLWYLGEDCSFFWIMYAGPAAAGLIIGIILIVLIRKWCCAEEQGQNTQLPEKEPLLKEMNY